MLGAAVLVVWWLLAASAGPAYFAMVNGFVTSWFGDLVMFAALWAVCYHFLSGLRHLYWDTGRGFEIEKAERLSKLVVVGSVVLAVIVAVVL